MRTAFTLIELLSGPLSLGERIRVRAEHLNAQSASGTLALTPALSQGERGWGFTLIELLVVITIIVVLLALLTPAMDRAIYAAEMAVCGANENATGTSILVYTVDFKRSYPHRS